MKTKVLKSEIPLSMQILIISLISLIWIIVYKLIFLKIQGLFPNAYEISEIVYIITASIISSSIFYYIVIYRPERQKFEKVKPYIEDRVSRFKLDYRLIVADIYKIKGLPVPHELPEDWKGFRDVCKGILLTSKPPVIYGNPPYQCKDWFEYFEYYISIEDSNKRMLYNYWEWVPIEVKILIEDLQTNTFHGGLRTYKETEYSDQLYDLAGPLWHHLNILSSLPNILNDRFKM